MSDILQQRHSFRALELSKVSQKYEHPGGLLPCHADSICLTAECARRTITPTGDRMHATLSMQEVQTALLLNTL